MRTLIFTLLFCTLNAGTLFALEITEELQLKVADTFFSEGEYYRAVTEYKKLSILFPDSSKRDYASYRIGLSYHLGEEYDNAITEWQNLRANYEDSGFVLSSQYME